jgi:hypothetical protein
MLRQVVAILGSADAAVNPIARIGSIDGNNENIGVGVRLPVGVVDDHVNVAVGIEWSAHQASTATLVVFNDLPTGQGRFNFVDEEQVLSRLENCVDGQIDLSADEFVTDDHFGNWHATRLERLGGSGQERTGNSDSVC